MLIHNL